MMSDTTNNRRSSKPSEESCKFHVFSRKNGSRNIILIAANRRFILDGPGKYSTADLND